LQERVEAERRVAYPAESVVPVPHSSNALGQRGGEGGDDAAGRAVGQRLEREQRADHGLPPGPLVGAALGPAGPVPLGVGELPDRIARGLRPFVTGVPGEDEGDRVAGSDVEAGDRRHSLTAGGDRALELQRVRPSDGEEAASGTAYPGDDRPVVEADD